MTRDTFAEKSAGARLRGAIQRGEAGDKVPGFDPAAAPYETDAEAGGTAQPADSDVAAQAVLPHDSNAASHGSSLRGFNSKDTESPSRQAPLREGPVYLIWWGIIAALLTGSLLLSWVWQ